MSETVIKVQNVGKKFCKSLKRSMLYGSKDIFNGAVGIIPDSGKLREGEFWAVEDLSFELNRGETIGLIGHNGSGKSTMLKMLNGIFMPDTGRIEITGKVGALIEIGAGFHPILSGRENVYINGAILGMTKKEIDRKFDAIVDFADIGDFIDAPIKHYSSGMFVRLGFAVAIHCEPDILLVDEVLAVGDLAYALKCHKKMSEFRKNGGTVIIVSHSMQAIRNICKKVIWLDHGRKKDWGDVYQVCDAYENEVIKNSESSIPEQEKEINYDPETRITDVMFLDENGDPCKNYTIGARLKIRIDFNCKRIVENPIFTVSIYTPDGIVISSNYSHTDGYNFNDLQGKGCVEYCLDKIAFRPAKYVCSITFSEGEIANTLDWHEKKYEFILTGQSRGYGVINPFPEWKLYAA